MVKYTRTEQKPLSEVIGSRREFYQGRISKAFDAVYKSKDFGLIEQFEKAVSELSVRANQGNLEGFLGQSSETQQQTEAPKKIDRRPRLTYYQFAKAKDAGMTNEEIKAKFRMNGSYQICGFAGCYKKSNNKKAEAEKK